MHPPLQDLGVGFIVICEARHFVAAASRSCNRLRRIFYILSLTILILLLPLLAIVAAGIVMDVR